MMAEDALKCLFLCLLFALTVCSSGTILGFSYDARKHNAIPSPFETISFLKLNKVSPSQIRVFVTDHQDLNSLSNTGVSVDLYLNKTLLENLRDYEPSTISRLKTHLTTFLPHVNIKSILVSGSRDDLPEENGIPMLLSSLKSVQSVLRRFHLEGQLKASVSFSLSFLENLDRKQKAELYRVLNFIKKVGSFVIVEANVDGELTMGDGFVESLIKRAAEIIPCSAASVVLKINNFAVPSAIEVAEFTDNILRSLENSNQEIIGLFAEVSPPEEFKQMFHSSHRELLENFHHKTTQHDTIYPPPMTSPAAPVTVSPDNNPAPTIVTVPSTNPVTVMPNPASTPVTVPSTTPVPVPSTNPVNSPIPITSPVTFPGPQPITNPVTTYPAPPTPVTTPVASAPPATTGSPAVPGQSWCVAKSGASEAAIQAALDYACGIGGADCSVIQQGASCYNPNTLQNHASYAFNSYYQKNPVQTSCDFGGTAMITNTNPSTGTCIYPSSSSSPSSSPITAKNPPSPTTAATPPPPTTMTPPPPPTPPSPPPPSPTMTAMLTPPPPATSSSPGGTVSGSPPTVLNTSYPDTGGTTVSGDSPPTTFNSSTSMATGFEPFIGRIILVTSLVTGRFILDL